MKSKLQNSLILELNQFKAQIKQLEEKNERLTQENQDLIRDIANYQIKISAKDQQIKQLQNQMDSLYFDLQLSQKQRDELYSALSINQYNQVAKIIQPQNRLSLEKQYFKINNKNSHMNYLSPKNFYNKQNDIKKCQNIKDISHQTIVQETQIQDYHFENKNKDYQIIGKYSQQKQEQFECANIKQQCLFQKSISIEQESCQQQIKQNSLFEEFIIISVSKSTLNGLSNNMLEKREVYLNPEFLFQHSSSTSCYKEQLQLLPQFIYPYGLKVKLEEKTLSMSNLNSILMSGQSYDRLAGAYVITMKSEESFTNNNIVNNPTFQNSDHINDLISISNVHHQIYCICVDVPDFYDYDVSYNKSKMKKKYFYSLSKTYCFITKAPIIDFFIETIKIIINTLKYKKAEVFSMNFECDEKLGNIDNCFFMKFKPQLQSLLRELQNSKFISQCNYQFLQTPIKPPIIHSQNYQYLEIEWTITYAFAHLELPHYLILLMSMLLEQNICIISSNRTLLSSLLMMLPHMIKPFQYIHSTICAITEKLLPIFDSPVPFICGIIKDSENGLRNLGIENDDSFYDEQHQVLFFDANKLKFFNLRNNLTYSCLYTKLFNQLFQTYQQLRLQSVPGEYLADNNSTTIDLSFKILNDTQTFIKENIISLIPEVEKEINLYYIQDQTLNSTQDEILKKIIQTQYFTYYLQQKFHPK